MLVVNESQSVPRSSSVYSPYFVANGNVEQEVSPPTNVCQFPVRFDLDSLPQYFPFCLLTLTVSSLFFINLSREF